MQLHLLLRVSQMLITRNCEGGSRFAVQPDTGKSPKRVEPENYANFVEAEVIWKKILVHDGFETDFDPFRHEG